MVDNQKFTVIGFFNPETSIVSNGELKLGKYF